VLKKPTGEGGGPSCIGCPLYEKSSFGFIEDDIPSTAKAVLCFDMPDARSTCDDARGVWEFKYASQNFIPFLQLKEWEVGAMHLLRCGQGRGKPPASLAKAIEHCRVHDTLNNDTVLVTVGELSWKNWSGNPKGTRNEWRSYCTEVEYESKDHNGISFRSTDGLDDLMGSG